MRELEIRQKLAEIRSLKRALEKRMWDGATPVKDIQGNELSEAYVKAAIKSLAMSISERFPNQFPVLVGLMDGALPFLSQLQQDLNELQYEFQLSTMQTDSYGTKTHSGKLTLGSLPKIPVADRVVLIIDDVCDTGKTAQKVNELFLQQGASEVHLVTLVDKKQEREIDPLFSGFIVDKQAFIIGYGLDYAGVLRNTSFIKAVDPRTLPTAEEQALLDSEGALNLELQQIIAAKTMHGENRNTTFAHSAGTMQPLAENGLQPGF